MAHAWLLNFFAEEELALHRRRREAGSADSKEGLAPEQAFTMKARLLEALPKPGLVEGHDVLVEKMTRANGLWGRAWMPTPNALARLVSAGANTPRAPGIDVLLAVNHRRFGIELEEGLPGACFATSLDSVEEAAKQQAIQGAWLLKRPFGFAGRGHLVVQAPLTERDRAWIASSLAREGGVSIEPLVARAADFALHGHLDEAGTLVLGVPTVQRCTTLGSWRGSTRAQSGELSSEEQTMLRASAERAANALSMAGYFGPFGIDAFRWTDGRGRPRFHTLCDLNARYTMGWSTGMGACRPDRCDE